MRRTPGFMSYSRDPSLRRHHFGPIEPLGETCARRRGLILLAGIFTACCLIALNACKGDVAAYRLEHPACWQNGIAAEDCEKFEAALEEMK